MSLRVQMPGAVRGAAGSLERDASALGSRGRGMVLSEPGWNVPAFLLSEMIPKSVLFVQPILKKYTFWESRIVM